MKVPDVRPWVVLKFGGTSVASSEGWQSILDIVQGHIDQGSCPMVVVSALAGVSDQLAGLLDAVPAGDARAAVALLTEQHQELAAELGLADWQAAELAELRDLLIGAQLIGEVTPRLRARVLAFGELLSSRLGAAFFAARGLEAAWVDARELLLAEAELDEGPRRHFLAARCSSAPDDELRSELAQKPVAAFITQGFIARDAQGSTVLLGRGGSDTSASCLAARLRAEQCEIWTDVPGLFTANPRHIPEARLLLSLDYEEAQEIATTGARVLHPGCLEPVRQAGLPLVVRCTSRPEIPGTAIRADTADSAPQVKAISIKSGIVLLTMDTLGMWQRVGFLADVFECFRQVGLSVDLVSTSETNVTVSLDPRANELAPTTLEELRARLERFCTAQVIGPCAAVSLVGRRIRAILHRLGPALQAFEEQKIHLVSQAASDLNITFVVDEDQAPRLVRQLHSLLFAHRGRSELLGPTWRELFGPPSEVAPIEQPVWWRERRAELLALADEQTPVYAYDPATLGAAVHELEGLSAISRILYSVKANANAEILRHLHGMGVAFECVSLGEVVWLFEVLDGLDPARVLFTPNFASRHEYAEALERGVLVTLDSLHPLQAWPELFAQRDLFVRFDPGRGRGHHHHVVTAGAASKFGVAPADAERVRDLAAQAGARVVGLHSHAGSGIFVPEHWSEVAALLASVAELFPEVQVLDLGGGLGVPYRPGRLAFDYPRLDRALERVRKAHPRYSLWLEPGRFVVAQAGVLLARVTQTKHKLGVRYVGVDAGMNSLLRPALYGAWHEIVNLTRLSEPAAMVANVVGPICESADTLGFDRRLPPTHEGDVLLIAATGAYGRSMASHYNLREPAGERML